MTSSEFLTKNSRGSKEKKEAGTLSLFSFLDAYGGGGSSEDKNSTNTLLGQGEVLFVFKRNVKTEASGK